jgi:hypothetical protein
MMSSLLDEFDGTDFRSGDAPAAEPHVDGVLHLGDGDRA